MPILLENCAYLTERGPHAWPSSLQSIVIDWIAGERRGSRIAILERIHHMLRRVLTVAAAGPASWEYFLPC